MPTSPKDAITLYLRHVLTAHYTLPQLVNAFFILAILITLTLNSFPFITSRLYRYGKNATPLPPSSPKHIQSTTSTSTKNPVILLLDFLSTLKVPHSFFSHFYALSLLVQVFWLIQIITHGHILQHVLTYYSSAPTDGEQKSQSIHSILLCMACMIGQSARRLYESVFVQKAGNSQMGIMIYVSGLLFYVAMGFATWCEGMDMLREMGSLPLSSPFLYHAPPRLNTLLLLPMFLIASGIQRDAHAYLASLVKYTFPTHPFFAYVVCPHYAAECIIYLSLAVLSAPEGEWWNKVGRTVAVFVVLNLGFTAGMSKEWYVKRFGREKVGERRGMIPFIW